jgi:hypothetical protein
MGDLRGAEQRKADVLRAMDSKFRLRPVRVQAYRGYDELEGRDVMRDGDWLN